MFQVSGILQTLTEVFKIGHRIDLLPRVDTVFDPILKSEVKGKFMAKSTNLRKYKVQLAQRIGCIFLKPKVTKWRY
jgi:tubulin-specific chaperone D